MLVSLGCCCFLLIDLKENQIMVLERSFRPCLSYRVIMPMMNDPTDIELYRLQGFDSNLVDGPLLVSHGASYRCKPYIGLLRVLILK